VQVEVEDQLAAAQGKVGERLVHRAGCVVDEDLDWTTELFDRLGYDPAAIGLIGEVGDDRRHSSAVRSEPNRRLLQRTGEGLVFVARPRCDRHVGALGRQPLRHRCPDAPAGAGDERASIGHRRRTVPPA